MLITGNQLRAARALAGVDQAWVAKAADVAINTIRNMEGRGSEPITSSAVTVRKVQLVLESAGIEFLNGGQPGVRMRSFACKKCGLVIRLRNDDVNPAMRVTDIDDRDWRARCKMQDDPKVHSWADCPDLNAVRQ
jgi:hypothetical protein